MSRGALGYCTDSTVSTACPMHTNSLYHCIYVYQALSSKGTVAGGVSNVNLNNIALSSTLFAADFGVFFCGTKVPYKERARAIEVVPLRYYP